MATMRYSAEPKTKGDETSGWIWKEGRFSRHPRKRFLRIQGTMLLNCRRETSRPTWKHDILGCEVLSGEFDDNRIIIKSEKRIFQFKTESPEEFRHWIMAFTKATKTPMQIREVHNFYAFGKMVGKGSNGEVYEATDKMTQERFAIKVMEVRNTEEEESFARRECEIVRMLDHDNIVRVHDVFRKESRLFFVLDFIEGGELFDIVAEESNFSEKQAGQVMRGILEGVAYLHSNHIAHRDLKLENILVQDKHWPLKIKITDFGLSGLTDGDQVLSSFVGTPFYLAPEIIQQQPYGIAVDMWSCGIILYVLIAGKFPFGGGSDVEYLKQVVRRGIRFPPDEWGEISEECKQFILGLLEKDPAKRITADDALKHPWMTIYETKQRVIRNDRSAMHSTRRLPRIDADVSQSIKFKQAV